MFYFLKMFKTIFIKQETLAPPPLKEGGLALVLYIESKVMILFFHIRPNTVHPLSKRLKFLR